MKKKREIGIEWDEFEKQLELTDEQKHLIEIEEQLIDAMIAVRESKGLSQAELADLSGVKQPAIARMERATHSPRLDSILKVLVPMGYTLEIVPIE